LHGLYWNCTIKRFLPTALIVLCPTPVLPDFDENLGTVERLRAEKRFAEALEIIMPLANESNVDAQVILLPILLVAEAHKTSSEHEPRVVGLHSANALGVRNTMIIQTVNLCREHF
jgi:hypothetical protein